MPINPDKLAKFKMSCTSEIENIKEIIGKTVVVKDANMTEYNDVDGVVHHVLTVNTDIGMYRTEVSNFIEIFSRYWNIFGDEAIEDRPKITITGRKSKRGNPYVSLTVEGTF